MLWWKALVWQEGMLIFYCWKMHIISHHLKWPSLYIIPSASDWGMNKCLDSVLDKILSFIKTKCLQLLDKAWDLTRNWCNLAPRKGILGLTQSRTCIVLLNSELFFNKQAMSDTTQTENIGWFSAQHLFCFAVDCLLTCSQPWRVFLLEGQSSPKHPTEALSTHNEDYWKWGWLSCCFSLPTWE